MSSIGRSDELTNISGAQTPEADAVAVAQLLSEIAGRREPREDCPSSQAMAAAARAAAAATAGSQQAELNSITSFMSRHLPRQQLFAASDPALDAEYSIRSAPAARLLIVPGDLATVDSDADKTESTFSAAISAGGGSTATPRRRKISDASSMQKLQALADVSEERLAKQEKRMMKNRESAARSRLRRQQHTEALEEQNAGLKAEVLGLRTQMAVLHARVAELEWQLQMAQTAADDAAAPTVTGAAAPTPMPAVALAAAVSGAAGALSHLNVQAGQPLSNIPLPAQRAGVEYPAAVKPPSTAPVAPLPGLPPLPTSQAGTSGGAPLSAAGGGSGIGDGCSSALIDVLVHALAKPRRSSAVSEHAPASHEQGPAAAGAAAAEEEAVSAEGAVAALLGMAGSHLQEADRCNSRTEQQEALSSQQLIPASSGPEQQQQQQQRGMLSVSVPLAAVQPLHQAQQQQQQARQQQPAASDLNQLIAAAMAAFVPSRMSAGKGQQSSNVQAAGANEAADLGALGATVAALQPAGTTSAAVEGQFSSSAPGGSVFGAPQDAVQAGVAAVLRAMQAAGRSLGAATTNGNGLVGRVDIGAPSTAALAAPVGGAEGERPSKRVCP